MPTPLPNELINLIALYCDWHALKWLLILYPNAIIYPQTWVNALNRLNPQNYHHLLLNAKPSVKVYDQDKDQVVLKPLIRLARDSHHLLLNPFPHVEYPHRQDLVGHTGMLLSLKLLGLNRLASGAWNGQIKIWDLNSGSCLHTLVDPSYLMNSAQVYSLCHLADGRLASGHEDRIIRIWNPDTGELIGRLEGHQNAVTSLLTLSNNQLMSSSQEGKIKTWDLHTNQCVNEFDTHEWGTSKLTLLPNNQLAAAFHFKDGIIWDRRNWQPIHTLSENNHIWSLALAHGDRLVVGGNDGKIKIWSLKTGKILSTLSGHSRYVVDLVCLPNGQLVSASQDCTLKIWDLESGTNLTTIHCDEIPHKIVYTEGTLYVGLSSRVIKRYDLARMNLDVDEAEWENYQRMGRQFKNCLGK